MNPIRLSAAVALLALAPAAPAETIPVAKFNSIELRGGGQVVLRHGPVQRVTLIKGSMAHSRIAIEAEGRRHDRLVLEPCSRQCPRNYEFEVEIVTPDLKAVAVRGGGDIATASPFPKSDSLAVAVTGGGQIDVRSARAHSVAAAVHGGGVILARPENSLAASVNGGGEIRYWGEPAVVTSINGGGTVTRGGAR